MITPLAAIRAISQVRRSVRRIFVLAAFAGYPLLQLGYFTLAATGRISQLLWEPMAVLLMSMTIFGLVAVYAFARNRAQLDGPDLDERQRALGTRSYALSYGVLVIAAWAILSPLALAVFLGGPVTITADAVGPAIIAASVYLPALPSAVLAWIEPDWREDGRS